MQVQEAFLEKLTFMTVNSNSRQSLIMLNLNLSYFGPSKSKKMNNLCSCSPVIPCLLPRLIICDVLFLSCVGTPVYWWDKKISNFPRPIHCEALVALVRHCNLLLLSDNEASIPSPSSHLVHIIRHCCAPLVCRPSPQLQPSMPLCCHIASLVC